MNDWTVETIAPTQDQIDKGKPLKISVMLKFKGRTILKGHGDLTEQSYRKQAEEWNTAGYVPKNGGGTCLADIPTEKRGDVLKRMKNSTPGFPSLMLDPEENRKAKEKFYGGYSHE